MKLLKPLTRTKNSLFLKLIGVFSITVFILFGITYAYFKNNVSTTFTQSQKQNEVLTQAVAASIGSLEELNDSPTESQFEKLFEPLNINKRIVNFTLIDRDGTIIYSKDPLQVGKIVDSQEVLRRTQQKNISTVSYSDEQTQQSVSDIITPVFQDSAAKQSLQITFSNTELKNLESKNYQAFSLITLLVGVIAGLTLYYLSRLIHKPLSEMIKGVNAISNDDFDYRIHIHRKDEIGLLASAFNNMAIGLQESRKRLSSEQSRLKEAKAELMASVKSLPFGFALINDKEEILYSNDALEKIIGHSVPADTHQSHELLKQLDKEYAHSFKLMTTLKEVSVKAKPSEFSLQVGTQFLRIFLAPVLVEHKTIGTILIIEDITEAKVLERSRDEFFSIASHELRTPLTTIRGNTNLILEYYLDSLKDPSLREMMGDIHDSSVRLIAIVNDFLDISRLEQNRMIFKIEPTNITNLLKESLEQYKTFDILHGLELKFASPGNFWAQADSDRTRQIINNLISNAIKYTEKGSITLSIEPHDKNLRILVSDTGQGIPIESQHLLFHKFQQASNNILTRDNSQSTGLGLYISSLLAQGMNGRVDMLKSDLGKGATFYLELPIAEEPKRQTKKDD